MMLCIIPTAKAGPGVRAVAGVVVALGDSAALEPVLVREPRAAVAVQRGPLVQL